MFRLHLVSIKSVKSLPLFSLLLFISIPLITSQPNSIDLLAKEIELNSVDINNNNINDNLPLNNYNIESGIDWIGDKLASALGFENTPISGGSGGIIGWSDSSLFVERNGALHPSRPSSFGPHIEDPLTSLLFPITIFSTSDEYGCEASNSSTSIDLPTPPEDWIALVQRGHCPFSTKVRFASSLGAVAVIFGDQSVENGGLSGLSGLLTPWSPDDTRDIFIPSAFVSRASYLSLLKTYEAEQVLIEEGSEDKPRNEDGNPIGLVVTMAADDLFSWPMLDFLLLLLFLPSMLTGITIFTQRIRQMRERKLARAPLIAVAQLPVFLYGELEKLSDEESSVGFQSNLTSTNDSETTPLLHNDSNTTTSARTISRTRRSLASTSVFILSYLPPLLRPIQSSIQLAPRRNITLECTECAICLGDFEAEDKVIGLPCGHIFHADEIREWLTESKKLCPTCRASITVDLVEDASTNSIVVPSSIIPTVGSTPVTPIPSPVLDRVASPVASSSSVTIESALSPPREE